MVARGAGWRFEEDAEAGIGDESWTVSPVGCARETGGGAEVVRVGSTGEALKAAVTLVALAVSRAEVESCTGA